MTDAASKASPRRRTGAELVRATKRFAREDRRKSWRLLIETLAILLVLTVAIVVCPFTLGKVALGILHGLVQIRLFIFFHDHWHGAILSRSKLASAIMTLVGFYQLVPPSVWRETHGYHHKHNAKLVGSSIGSFPLLTVGMYRAVSKRRQRAYRVIRHPLNIAFGYVTVFVYGMAISPFLRAPRRHWGGPVAVVAHLSLVAFVSTVFDVATALCAVVLPLAVTLGMGSFLFFAQHNFQGCTVKSRHEWEYTYAALHSSSMFDMGPPMHWFTGNIGYHHVHHLNHRIPFYRLPEAMAAIPELQRPTRVTWSLRDVASVLRCAAWDPSQGRMVTYRELDTSRP